MKSGFIAIIGRPNVGKSSLINAILGTKLSIVTNKSQTTRNNIKGIYTKDDVQIVFLDTPGIHEPHKKLNESLNSMAYQSLKDADGVVLVVDAKEKEVAKEYSLENLNIKVPLFIVINKIDLIHLEEAIRLKEKYLSLYPNATLIETVATKNFNVDELLKRIIDILPEGQFYYPEEDLTDRDMRFVASEIIREKILILLKEEVPHSLAVIIEGYKEKSKGVEIDATIIVEKTSQRAIVLGKEGKMIKRIGSLARKEIENMSGEHVYLNLFVKVEADWRNNDRLLKLYGYDVKKN